MAITKTSSTVTWNSGVDNFKNYGALTSTITDPVVIPDNAISMSLTVFQDNQVTPLNSADYVDYWLLWSNGDVDGIAGDDYDTAFNAEYLGRLAHGTSNGNEDPIIRTWDLPISAKSFCLKPNNGSASGNSIQVRARVTIQTAS